MPSPTGLVDRIRARLQKSPASIVDLVNDLKEEPAKVRSALRFQKHRGYMKLDDNGRWHVVDAKPAKGGAAHAAAAPKSPRAKSSLQEMVRDKLASKAKSSPALVAGFPPAPSVPQSTAYVQDLLAVRARVIESAVRKVQQLDALIASHAE